MTLGVLQVDLGGHDVSGHGHSRGVGRRRAEDGSHGAKRHGDGACGKLEHADLELLGMDTWRR